MISDALIWAISFAFNTDLCIEFLELISFENYCIIHNFKKKILSHKYKQIKINESFDSIKWKIIAPAYSKSK